MKATFNSLEAQNQDVDFFGNILRNAINNEELSQKEIGKKYKLTQARISMISRGDFSRYTTAKKLISVCIEQGLIEYNATIVVK